MAVMMVWEIIVGYVIALITPRFFEIQKVVSRSSICRVLKVLSDWIFVSVNAPMHEQTLSCLYVCPLVKFTYVKVAENAKITE